VPDVGDPAVSRGDLDKLIGKILDDRGLDLGQYRRAYVERRLAARLRTLELRTYREYSDRLAADPGEYAHLVDTLTINVTDFFRDKPVWDILRKRVLPDIIADKMRGRSRTIRVWSAGCASGEEPYSIAMTILDALGPDADKFLITILGTDLDPDIIETATRGVYDKSKLKHIQGTYQVRFTRSVNQSSFEILPEVRRHVRFRHSSLFGVSPMKVADLILCRNVFIYLDRARQAKVLETFWGSMARGGYMVLGRSEKMSAEAARRFEPVEPKERVYRKPTRI
jgi:chemotaxis methyl-accepting protein methylase